MLKEEFFLQAITAGKTFAEAEKEWLISGFAIKRGKSAKDNIVHAWLEGEVTMDNLKEWLASNGTDNDVKQASYYVNRLKDFELIKSSLSGKKKQA